MVLMGMKSGVRKYPKDFFMRSYEKKINTSDGILDSFFFQVTGNKWLALELGFVGLEDSPQHFIHHRNFGRALTKVMIWPAKIGNTLAARGLEEPCASFPDFCDNCQFHVIYCVSSYFEEFLIHDSRSRGFMILKKIWPNLLGLHHFLLNT